MRRIYDRDARKALARFFENCAKAVRKKTIADPDSLGEVAQFMRGFVKLIEEQGSGGDSSDALETFEFSELHRDFPQELAEVLWRKTGVTLGGHAETEETELADEEREATRDQADSSAGNLPELSCLTILVDHKHRLTSTALDTNVVGLLLSHVEAVLGNTPIGIATPEQLGSLAGNLLTIAYGETSGDEASGIFETFNAAMNGAQHG